MASVTRCNVCRAPAKYHCGGCYARAYCSKTCQKNDWMDSEHKNECLVHRMSSVSLIEEEADASAGDQMVGAKFKDFDTKHTRKLSRKEIVTHLGPAVEKIWEGVDVYVVMTDALTGSKARQKQSTSVAVTERGIVVVFRTDAQVERGYARLRANFEKNTNFFARQYRYKYDTVVSSTTICEPTKMTQVAVQIPGGASETYNVLDLAGSDKVAQILSTVAHRAIRTMEHVVHAGAVVGLTEPMIPRAAQAATIGFYQQNVSEAAPNCRYLGAVLGAKIRIVVRTGPTLEKTLSEIAIALTLFHELTHFVVDTEGVELRMIFGKPAKVAHGNVFYGAFGAIVKSAAAAGALPSAWGRLSAADIKRYADVSHQIGMSQEIMPPELLGEPGVSQTAAGPAVALPSPLAPTKRTRLKRDADEGHVPLSSRIVSGYKAPVPDSLDAVFGLINAQKIRDWHAREYDIGDVHLPNLFRNLYKDQTWWPPSGNMIMSLFEKNLSVSEIESYRMLEAFVDHVAGKDVNTYVATRSHGQHTGWFVDVPGIRATQGEKNLQEMVGNRTVYEWVEQHKQWMTAVSPNRSVTDLIQKLRMGGIVVMFKDAAEFIATAILVPSEETKPSPAPVPPVVLVAPSLDEKEMMRECIPLRMRKGFKTVIPRSVDAIPKVSGRALVAQYKTKTTAENANVECVTAAMIWQLRRDLGKTEFAKWYTNSATQQGAAAALDGIEAWFNSVRADGPDPGELSAWPGKIPASDTSTVHSGWLVDVPGFKPKITEDRHVDALKEFKVLNAYDLVHVYNTNHKKKLVAVLDKYISRAENVAHALEFLDKAKLV